MVTAGKQLEAYVLPDIRLIRTGLGAEGGRARRGAVTQNTRPDMTPQAVAVQAASGQWQHATYDDPMVRKLDQLIGVLNQLSTMPEDRGSLPRLDAMMRGAVEVAEELQGTHRLSSVRVSTDPGNSTTFDTILRRLRLVSKYYAHLAFCQTSEGIAWIKEVMGTTRSGEGSAQRMHLHPHQIVENLEPFAKNRWKIGQWKTWYLANVEQGKDPIESFVEFLLSVGIDLLTDEDHSKARLASEDDYRGVALARIRNGLPGTKHGTGSLPRIYTFQVKVLGSSGKVPRWVIPTRFTENMIAPPVLVPLNSGWTGQRRVSTDFAFGSIYAMDGPDRMYCLPPAHHHSALMSGDPISAAGILVAVEGRVVAIDNRSGHYQPGFRQLLMAVRYLIAKQLFESDAFVSLYVGDLNALYFSPTEFVQLALSYFNFSATMQTLSRQAARFSGRLPVPTQHAHLIPPMLSDFPVITSDPVKGKNRWDWMALEFYSSKGADLQGIVTRLEEILAQESGAVQPGGWARGTLNRESPGGPSNSPELGAAAQRQGAVVAYRQLVASVAQRLRAGGAYVDILPMLDRLIAASSSLAGTNGRPPASTGVFNSLKMQASLLRPAGTIL